VQLLTKIIRYIYVASVYKRHTVVLLSLMNNVLIKASILVDISVPIVKVNCSR